MLLTKVPRISPDSAEHRLRVWTVLDKLPSLCRCGSEVGGGGGHQGCGLQGRGQPPRKREGRCASLGQSVQAAPPASPPSATRLQQLWYSSYAVLLGQEPSLKITFQWAGRCGPSGRPAHSFPYRSTSRVSTDSQRNVSRPFKIIFIHTGREKAGLAAEQKHPFTTAWSLF